MKKESYHVTPSTEGRWVVRKTGSDRAQKAFSTQKDAVEFARTHVKVGKKVEVELYIHGRDGRISQKDTYGSDPRPPKRKR